jgi:hypothetical protein
MHLGGITEHPSEYNAKRIIFISPQEAVRK